ncbi:Protein CL16A [Coemansia sp. RSA 1199]|nr:Protein CL16A [Coemansia sp. RSA 1199]
MFGPFLTLLGLADDPGKTHPPPTPAELTAAEQSHECERRRAQIQRLAAYLKAAHGRSSRKRLVENIRLVSEVVIWSDRRNPELLSLVIEVGLHQHMLALLHTSTDGAVAVQVLQTFSIILDSVSDPKFLYSLFSNNFVNDLIAAPIDMDSDEIVPYYVAFLKALSLRLTADTIHFFFNERLTDFPLYTTAVALFDHPDAMVRVAVRAITLNVFRINDPGALEFILHSPRCAHFWELIVCSIKDSYDDALRILVDMLPMRRTSGVVATSAVDRAHTTETQGWAAVDQVLERHMGLLAYVNDIFGLGVDRINRRLTAELSDRILARTFVHAIDTGWRANASPEETLFMQIVTLFVAHFFSIVRHSPLLVDAVTALFAADSESTQPRLAHPFIPSPFESSRTLTPWLCAVLEILRNKAISPTTLVKSVLTPRRMLRTRALLESLTGTASLNDCSSSVQSALSMSPAIGPAAIVTSSPGLHNDEQPINRPLPPFTQTIATAMVQILAEDPPTHTWITIDLAALVLAQLARNQRGHLILDSSLHDELVLAQRTRSAELRALLMPVNSDSADGDQSESNEQIACGSYKVLVQCLADLANSDSETLTMKVQFEARHIFAPERSEPMTPPSPTHSQPVNRRSSTSSATVNPLSLFAKSIITPISESLTSTHSSHTSLHSLSPFEALTPYHVLLSASIHQAFHLQRLSKAAVSSKPIVSRGSFVPDLQKWLGQNIHTVTDPFFSVTCVDNTAKHGLPRSVPRLGFPALVQCHDGCLVIHQQADQRLELVWPMADIVVDCEDPVDSASLPSLRIRDTMFPPLFYPPRPTSMGGINTITRTTRVRTNSGIKPRHLARAYLGRHELDISLRLDNTDALHKLVCEHIIVSRHKLAAIYLDHNVV